MHKIKHLIFSLLCIIHNCHSHIAHETVVASYKKIFLNLPHQQPASHPHEESYPPLLLYALAVGIDIFSNNAGRNLVLIRLMERDKAKNTGNTLLYYQSLGPYAHIQIGHKEIINALYSLYTRPCHKERILDTFIACLAKNSIRIEGLHKGVAVWIMQPLLRATIKSCIKDRSLHQFGTHVVYEVRQTALWEIPCFLLKKTGFYDMCSDLFSKKSSHDSHFLYTDIYDKES